MFLASRILISSRVCFFFSVVLAHSCFAQSTAAQSPVWRTINIGSYRNVIDLREALEASQCAIATPRNSHMRLETIPCKLGDSANEIIGRPEFKLSRTPRQIQLVLISGKDLGFQPDSQPSLREIYERAEGRGYLLCPPEAGAQLRLQYTNQKVGEFLPVAMRPVPDYSGHLTIFSVGNGGTALLLIGTSGSPEVRVPATVSFVFVRPSAVADQSGKDRAATAIQRKSALEPTGMVLPARQLSPTLGR